MAFSQTSVNAEFDHLAEMVPARFLQHKTIPPLPLFRLGGWLGEEEHLLGKQEDLSSNLQNLQDHRTHLLP